MQNKTFDPGGSQDRLRACPVLGSWRAFLCGEVMRVGAAGDELQHFSDEIRWLFETRPALMLCQKKVMPSRAARGYRRDRQRLRRQ